MRTAAERQPLRRSEQAPLLSPYDPLVLQGELVQAIDRAEQFWLVEDRNVSTSLVNTFVSTVADLARGSTSLLELGTETARGYEQIRRAEDGWDVAIGVSRILTDLGEGAAAVAGAAGKAARLPSNTAALPVRSPDGAARLVNAPHASIDPRKLTEYALSPTHPVGRHKARVFESALGFTGENCDELLRQIRRGLLERTPMLGKIDDFGVRFTVDVPVKGPAGEGLVRTAWIFKAGSRIPSLVTLMVR